MSVATVLTVYGIETRKTFFKMFHDRVATVLTVYGIETYVFCHCDSYNCIVATVLTVYGIETDLSGLDFSNQVLQQYLPFTVLKLP